MTAWTSSPKQAWKDHIGPAASSPNWVEDSKDISSEIKLSKRELYGLILFAQLYSHAGTGWLVGYDVADSEPNDGYITDGNRKIMFEHKVVAQMDKREVLNGILGTYEKYAAKGKAYGENRVLIIHANRPAKGLVRISDLRDLIGENCPFDRVVTLSCVTMNEKGKIAVMHLIQHYPPINKDNPANMGIAQIDFNTSTGVGKVELAGLIVE